MILFNNCYLCHSNNLTLLYTINDCNISKCSNCNLVFCTSYEHFESSDIYEDYNEDNQLCDRFNSEGKQNYKIFKRHVSNFDENESLFDFGCGMGYFLAHFKEKNNKVGFEISNYQVNHGKKLGLTIYGGKIDELLTSGLKFRYITLNQVIEHFQNPIEILGKLSKLLSNEGELFITTPNVLGITSKITKSRWLVLYPPLHLFYFDPNTLKQILQKSGFEIKKIATENIDPYNILLRKKISPNIRGQVGQDVKNIKHKRKWLTKSLYKVRDGVNYMIRFTGQGDNLIVVAKKYNLNF